MLADRKCVHVCDIYGHRYRYVLFEKGDLQDVCLQPVSKHDFKDSAIHLVRTLK